MGDIRATIAKTVCILLLAFAVQVKAQIISVTASNSPARVSISTAGHSLVRWNVVDDVANGGNLSVNSVSGVFRAPDQSILGTISRPLRASRNNILPGNTTFTFVESLLVPQTVIRQAQAKGFGTFYYSRRFTDFPDNTSRTAQVTFSITGGSLAGILTVQRVAMEFDDGRISAVIPPQSEMRARALIRYNGSGLLEYSWEVAAPPSTLGQPIFVALINRKQFLLVGQEIVLQSPWLPTAAKGQYLLRLRINRPAPAFELPLLRYAVNGSGLSGPKARILALDVLTPATNSILSRNTRFEWKPVPSTKAYQLELYTRPFRDTELVGFEQQAPIAGILVPAKETRVSMGRLSSAHLVSGKRYYWRVIAFSEKGRVIARSVFRTINIR